MALKARDHFANELDGQVLISPLLDPFMGTASFRKADAIGMRERWTEGWSHYLSGGVCHPYAAPCICSRLAGVAPALVLTAEDDPLCDETIGYAERLKRPALRFTSMFFPPGQAGQRFTAGDRARRRAGRTVSASQFCGFVREISIQ